MKTSINAALKPTISYNNIYVRIGGICWSKIKIKNN
nr:MAG TPA: hypothetical protein [Caudoviricetes sp.]